MLRKALSTARDAICASEAGLATHTCSRQLYTTPSTGGFHYISSTPSHPRVLASSCQGLSPEFSTSFSDTLANSSYEVMDVTPRADPIAVLPEHGPCIVGGIITLDDAFFTTKIAVHSDDNPLRPTASWRSLTLAPHRPSSDATYWIAFVREGKHPSLESGNVLLIPEVMLTNLPLRKLRRASA